MVKGFSGDFQKRRRKTKIVKTHIAKSGPYKGLKVLSNGKYRNKPVYYSWQIFGKKKKKYK